MKNLEPGDYYWAVQSVGENGRESLASPINFVRVVQKGDTGATIVLEIDSLMQHGYRCLNFAGTRNQVRA